MTSRPSSARTWPAHADRVRSNAEVIPLVRDVPLEVQSTSCSSGGWDREVAHSVFAELELRHLWNRLTALMEEGALGEAARVRRSPSPGSTAPGGYGRAPGPGPAAAGWRARRLGALDRAGAARRARRTCSPWPPGIGGRRRWLARWTGEAGRSPLASLTLDAERRTRTVPPSGAVAPGQRCGRRIAARRSAACSGPWPSGSERTARGGGPRCQGADAVAAPPGVDITGWPWTPRSAAYLLDPSTDRYRLRTWPPVPRGGCRRRHGATGRGLRSRRPRRRRGARPGGGPAEPAASARTRVGAPGGGAGPAAGAPAARAAVTSRLHDEVEPPLVRVLARMEVVGDRRRPGGAAAIADGLTEECARWRPPSRSRPASRSTSTRRRSCAPCSTRSSGSPRRQDQDRLLDRRPDARAAAGPAPDRRGPAPLPRGGEAPLHLRREPAGEVADDGRIHATFRQTVARTGRLSSDRPNLHNIPVRTEEGRRFREAFVPAPGRRLLVADYDQIELRVIAHLSPTPGSPRPSPTAGHPPDAWRPGSSGSSATR